MRIAISLCAALFIANVGAAQCSPGGPAWNDGNVQAITMGAPWTDTSPSGGPVEVTGPRYHELLDIPEIDHQGRPYNLGFVASDQSWFDCSSPNSTVLAHVGVWHLSVFNMGLAAGSLFSWQWITPSSAVPTPYPQLAPHFGMKADADHPKLQAVFFDPAAPAAILFSNALGCAFSSHATSETSAEYLVSHSSTPVLEPIGTIPGPAIGFEIPGWAAIAYPVGAVRNGARLQQLAETSHSIGFWSPPFAPLMRTTWSVGDSGYGWRIDTDRDPSWRVSWSYSDAAGPGDVAYETATVIGGVCPSAWTCGYWIGNLQYPCVTQASPPPPNTAWVTTEALTFTKPFPHNPLSPYADWTMQ